MQTATSSSLGSRRVALMALATGVVACCGQALAQVTYTATTSTRVSQPEPGSATGAMAAAERRPAPMLDDIPDELRNAEWFTPRSKRNGALAYYKSFVLISSREFRAKLSEIDWDAVGSKTDRSKMPESFLAVESQLSPSHIEAVREAAMMTFCNWESPYEFGISTLLPYLGDMRATGRTMRVAVRQGMLEGKPREAADRFEAMVGVARDAATDPALICSLVGNAIAMHASAEAKQLAESGQLTEAARGRMIAALEAINTEDFMGVRRAVMGERDVFLAWVGRTFDGPDAAVSFAKMMEDEGNSVDMLAIKALSDEQFKQGVEDARRYYDEAIRIWDAPDAMDRIGEMEGAVKRGAYGPLACILAPGLIKTKTSQVAGMKDLVDAIEALRSAKVRDLSQVPERK